MHYECLLMGLNNIDWASNLKKQHNNYKLVLHQQTNQYCTPVSALSDPVLLHGRYDATLIYINQDTISSWRAAFSTRDKNISLPLIIYAANLKSQTLKDFLDLGAADFISPPFSTDEFRTRIENAIARRNNNFVSENIKIYNQTAQPPPHTNINEAQKRMCDNILERSGTELEAYAVALATQKATDKSSFRAAKNEIISHFEQAYIKASLNRHSGNVTLAARMAQKHRRAFWALMKKHNIDPNPYRIL